MEKLDCAVIGAGVIGLAAARELLMAGRDVVVLERGTQIGSEISSRNSGVIHAGIYYPPGSQKARLCVAGKAALYHYCSERHIEAPRIGKLIVANDDTEIRRLSDLKKRSVKNGVDDLRLLSGEEARKLEPALRCEAALLSPSTGILDVPSYLLALRGDVETLGGMIAFDSPVISGQVTDEYVMLQVGNNEQIALACRTVINAAGLGAIDLAAALTGFPAKHLPHGYLAKGRYLSLSGKSPFSHLIYPIPTSGGLGIHLTLDTAGQARFGPDVEWVDAIDYSVPPDLGERFAQSIRRFWPELDVSRLDVAYAGIRPKLHGPDQNYADFLIQGPSTHGVPNVINLFGIESPGLTSSLAIAQEVAHLSCGITRTKVR